MLIQVFRRRTKDSQVVGQFAAFQAAIRKRRIAQRQIEAPLDKVELHIGESQVEADTRMRR